MNLEYNMGKKKDVSKEKIAVIHALLDLKTLSQRNIAKRANVSQGYVAKVVKCRKNSKKKKPIVENKRKNSGRRKKLSDREERSLKRMSIQNRQLSSTELSRRVSQNCGKSISAPTVRKILISKGMVGRRPRRKPKLTPRMVKNRLEWYDEHQNKTIADWEKVSTSSSMFVFKNIRPTYINSGLF